MIQWYFPFTVVWLSWEICCQISIRNSSVREKSLPHNVINPSVFVLTYAEFIWFKYSYKQGLYLFGMFDHHANISQVWYCASIMHAKSVSFSKSHSAKTNLLTSVEMYKSNPEHNFTSKVIEQKENTKLFLLNIWVLSHVAILQPHHSKSTFHPV